MRRILLGLLAGLGIGVFADRAQAQLPVTNVNDPFFLYYGFFLPRQQAQALQSGPEATINALSAARQSYAATNRSDMFDPYLNSMNRFDTDSDFLSAARGRGVGVSSAARIGGNLSGKGVASGSVARFGRTGGFHPTLRSGQSRNANVAVVRGRGNFGGTNAAGMGLPNMSPNAGVR